MNKPNKEDYRIDEYRFNGKYVDDIERYCEWLENLIPMQKKYDFSKDSFGNDTTKGMVEAIVAIIEEISKSSDMTFKEIIEYIMWNYDIDWKELDF